MEEHELSAEDEALVRKLIDDLLHDPQRAALLERDGFVERFQEGVGEALRESGDQLLDTLLERAPEMLAEHRAHRAAFEAELLTFWGEAFDLYETLHVCCKEAGRDFFDRYLPDPDVPHDYVFDALMRLHARACLVTSEVLTLLRAGFPSGAHARWRTIHELAVVAFFITEHGQEIARRYLVHDAVQRYKSAVLYNLYHEKLGYEPFDSGEFEAIERARNDALDEFGPGFGKDWGWAIPALGENTSPTFKAVEEATGMDHLRPYYRMASDPAHANAHASFYDLGLHDPAGILVGPSPIGFADPGHGACSSLFQVTICVLAYRPDLRNAMTMNALSKMLDRVGEAFLEAQRRAEAALKAGYWDPAEPEAESDSAAEQP
jgi:hypothetical protein